MPPKKAATAADAAAATLEKLAERFPVEDHKKNPKGYTYIAIEKVIGRLNEVLGTNWDLEITNVDYSLTPGLTYGSRNPKPGAYAVVVVKIEALVEGRLTARMGVGGDFGAYDDTDKLVKTALAEAIKKAGNQFGIGLYLWDEEERALIESAQAQGMTGLVQAAPALPVAPIQPVTPDQPITPPAVPAGLVSEDELTALKNEVADIAVLQGVQRTGPAIAAHFGITVEQLQDSNTLRALIAQHKPQIAG